MILRSREEGQEMVLSQASQAKMIVRKLKRNISNFDPFMDFYTILHCVNDSVIKVCDCCINECTNSSELFSAATNVISVTSFVSLPFYSIPDRADSNTSALAVLLTASVSNLFFLRLSSKRFQMIMINWRTDYTVDITTITNINDTTQLSQSYRPGFLQWCNSISNRLSRLPCFYFNLLPLAVYVNFVKKWKGQ